MFKRNKRVFVAYADPYGRNEFLIRYGIHYYVLTSQRVLTPISAGDAYHTLRLIQEKALSFRGIGSFNKLSYSVMNDLVQELAATSKKAFKNVMEGSN